MSVPTDAAADHPDAPSLPDAPLRTSRLLTFAGLAGLAAGLIAWAIGEPTQHVFAPPISYIEAFGSRTPKVDRLDQIRVDYKNALVAYGLLGGSLGLCLGLAGGLARRSVALGVKAGVLGLVVGSLLATAAGAAILPAYYHAEEVDQETLSQDLLLPLLVHAGCWGVAGLAGGLILGWSLQAPDPLGRKRPALGAIGGLLGAVLAAIIFEVVGGFAFTNDKTGEPVSRTVATRLIARVLVGLLSGSMAALVVNSSSRPKPAQPAAPPTA